MRIAIQSVKPSDDFALVTAYGELNTSTANCLHLRATQNLLRITNLCELFPIVLRWARSYVLVQLRCGHNHCIAEQVARKIALNLCAVLKGDSLGYDDRCATPAAA